MSEWYDDDPQFDIWIEQQDRTRLGGREEKEDQGGRSLPEWRQRGLAIDPRVRKRLPAAYKHAERAQQARTLPQPQPAARSLARSPAGFLLASFGVVILLMVGLAVFNVGARPVSVDPALPASPSVAIASSTPVPTRTPVATYTPTAIPIWTDDASWTPDGARFSLARPASWAQIGQPAGGRCLIRLPIDPQGNTPQVWIPCAILAH